MLKRCFIFALTMLLAAPAWATSPFLQSPSVRRSMC